MEHVRQTELIRLAANELADPRRAEVQRHLAECSACQRRYQRQEALWHALGQWTPDWAERDQLPELDRRLSATQSVLPPFWSRVARISRVAAAIVIGVGGGHIAARYWSPVEASTSRVVSVEVEQVAMEALGVRYIEDISPAGLYVALPGMASDAENEEGPQ